MLGTFTEGEIKAIFDELKDADKEALCRITAEAMTRSRTVDTTKLERDRSKTKAPAITKEQKLSSVIVKIRDALQNYESVDTIDVWKVKFQVGVNYNDCGLDKIRQLHNEFVSSATGTEQIKLLIYTEKGRLYDHLKFSEDRKDRWANRVEK